MTWPIPFLVVTGLAVASGLAVWISDGIRRVKRKQ